MVLDAIRHHPASAEDGAVTGTAEIASRRRDANVRERTLSNAAAIPSTACKSFAVVSLYPCGPSGTVLAEPLTTDGTLATVD